MFLGMRHVLNDEGDFRDDAFLAGAIAEIPADRLGDGLGVARDELQALMWITLATWGFTGADQRLPSPSQRGL